MDGCPGGLTDFFNLAAFLPNNGSALAGGHQQVQVQSFFSFPGPFSAISAVSSLSTLQGLAYEGIGLKYKILDIIQFRISFNGIFSATSRYQFSTAHLTIQDQLFGYNKNII